MLLEKYDFSEQDANDMADFLVPILDFVPEKRPTAAQLLIHPWITVGSRILQPSIDVDRCQTEKKKRENDEAEAMQVGVGKMVIDGASKPVKEGQRVLHPSKNI